MPGNKPPESSHANVMDDEDFLPGQRDEIRRQRAVEEAVHAADHIILEASNASKEETDYLTGRVAEAFVNKVLCRLNFELLRHDLETRVADLMENRAKVTHGRARKR